MARPDGYPFPEQNIETVVGNGRLIARARAGSADFVFAGPGRRLDLRLDGAPVDDQAVDTFVRPRRSVYTLPGRGAVTHACAADALLYVVAVEGAGEWTLALEADDVASHGKALVATGDAGESRAEVRGVTSRRVSAGGDALTVHLRAGERAAFVLGDPDAVAAAPPDAADLPAQWEADVRARGLRLTSPAPELDLALDFAKAHMQLGYDWRPAGHPEMGKMVCDIFRWREVWSRDFGSGFGPGAIAAGLYDAALATADYEAARYAAHDPAGLKVSDDTSQGGSAESLGWVLKLVWRLFKHTGDRDWLARTVAAFEPWVEHWTRRDADGDGLVVDVTEWMDHSRFLRLPEGQRTLYSNVLYYAALRRMAHICAELGRAADAERYRDLADRSRTALHDDFWNDAGYFNNAVAWGVTDTTLMLADNAIAVVERVASRNERFQVLRTIRERSWRAFGTVTTDLPIRYLDADNDHNGKVWPWWMAHEAKARFQNFDAEGGLRVLEKITDTFRRPTLPGLCEEYVHPDDGSQDDVVGHAFITGSGALLDAVANGLVGLTHVRPGDQHVRLAPAVPRTWATWRADLDLYAGHLSLEQTPDGYRVTLDGTRVELLELRIPPREAAEFVALDGAEMEPEREEDGASTYLRFHLAPGERHVIDVTFAHRAGWAGEFAMPALPPPVPVARPLLMDEPRLFADILQGFVRNAVSYFGRLRHVAADEIGALGGAGDLLVVVGNELPWQTKRGESVPDMLDAFLDRGGSLLLLGPRFPRVDLTAHYHGGAQMGGHAGMFWWKLWRDGRWQDFRPRTGDVTDAPVHDGAVYWGGGPLFAAWEHGLGLFGMERPCRGVYDTEGQPVDLDQPVDIVYTDWTVVRPWTFTPLAFTRSTVQHVTGPHRERYPCAALLSNEETGARIVVVAPALCSRTDLLHHILSHVAAPAA